MGTLTTTAAVNTSIADVRAARVERILALEGDESLQNIIRQALVSEEYEVEIVSNGITILELVRQKRFSTLIVDLQSSGSQGRDLCREITKAVPAIPFVLLK
jgi:DNA-binding response OmpR family regulator